MFKKVSGAILFAAMLSGCNAQQAANVQTAAQKAAANFQNAVQVGCTLDGKFVPIGQDAASVLAPAVGATNAAAGTLLTSAVIADKALVHPAVVAVCKSLLGGAAEPAAQVLPNVPDPTTPVAAPAPAVKPAS